MAELLFPAFYQHSDNNGTPLAGGTLTFYRTGTTTKRNTYSDKDLATANPNPITLDSAGRAQSSAGAYVPIFGESADYKVILKSSDGSTTITHDPIPNADSSNQATTKSDLKALATGGRADGEAIYVAGRDAAGDGGQGWFRWDSSDLSTEVGNDTQEGIYVPPDSDATGASGAWVRQYDALNAFMFGADGATAATDETAVSAMLTMAGNEAARAFIDPSLLAVSSPTRFTRNVFVPKDKLFLPRGDVTVSSADEIKDAVESLDDGDTITISGTGGQNYTIAGPIKPRSKGLTIRCANKNDVHLTTHWDIGISGRIQFENVQFIHPSGGDSNAQLFYVRSGLVQFNDTDMTGGNATSGGRAIFCDQFGAVQMNTNGSDMTINYNGSGVDTQLLSFKGGTEFRLTSSDRVIIRLDTNAEILDLDGAVAYLANPFIDGPGKASSSGVSTSGIVLRRGARCRVNRNQAQGAGIFECEVGLRAQHGSIAYLSGNSGQDIQVHDCGTGLTPVDGGLIIYDNNTMSFSGNDTNQTFNGPGPSGIKVLDRRQSALTSKDGSTVNSGDATTDGVIENNRTRIEEIETRLQALNFI